VCKSILCYGILKSDGDVLLPHYFLESLGPPFTGEYLIGHWLGSLYQMNKRDCAPEIEVADAKRPCTASSIGVTLRHIVHYRPLLPSGPDGVE